LTPAAPGTTLRGSRLAKDDVIPRKKSAPSKAAAKTGEISPSMLRLMRITRAAGIASGGFVTTVGLMSVVGLAVEAFWVRLVLALLVVVGLPAFVSDRFLKKTSMGGGIAMVADIFAIVLLGIALVLVAADFASKPLLVREGDRYARSGSRSMARVVYYLGGVSPVFPDEKPRGAAGGGPSGAPSASAPPGASR
jgi:hypothetical protein